MSFSTISCHGLMDMLYCPSRNKRVFAIVRFPGRKMKFREKRWESANLSSSFEKCVYYSTSFNMYQWHTPSDEMDKKKVREVDFWRRGIERFVIRYGPRERIIIGL